MFFCCVLSDDEIMSKNERIELLIGRLAAEGINAMDELYRLIRTDIYAFALSKTGNSHDAGDITQDTFVQIYRYAKAYKPQGKPLAWIFTIVANLANRLHLVQGRCDTLDETFEETPDDKNFGNDIINNQFLKQLLNTLKPEEQQIIVLHIVSGLKHAEIARLLDIPLSTVLSKYNRAIKKLQKNVKEEDI